MNLPKIKKFLLDLLFPIECLSCGSAEVWICQKCLRMIKKISCPICPFCHKPTPLGKVCVRCRPQSFLKGVLTACSYEDKLLQEAIHLFKYKSAFELKIFLGELLTWCLKNNLTRIPALKDSLVVPVPLHPRRLRQRGFNQAELLAEQVARSAGLTLRGGILERKKYTPPQVGLKRAQRLQNLKNNFVCGKPDDVRKKSILLVDDVATTTTTLNECARALQKAGAGEIWGLVLARN